MTVAWHPELTAKLIDVTCTKALSKRHMQRIGGRSVGDDAMDAFAECYPLRDSAAYQYKTSPAFSKTVDDDDLISDEEMDLEEENDALDVANAIRMFDRGDNEL
ncbi:hypothetical protein EJD97_007038 [Solanum chilense]|uniref:Uncharacterized protein n=1 Tax=Solanum chilense TaxID=4083 RepID=A0A6N2AHS2_SOLCI|nr:hypothetical protein EJD97_007038 [Solanum chilense]